MKSRIAIGILIVLVVFGALAGVKTLQIKKLMDSGKTYVQAPESVSSAVVHEEKWQVTLTAIGSVTAVQGVTVTPELPGIVSEITFESGAVVSQGRPARAPGYLAGGGATAGARSAGGIGAHQRRPRTDAAQPEHGLAIRAGYGRGHA